MTMSCNKNKIDIILFSVTGKAFRYPPYNNLRM